MRISSKQQNLLNHIKNVQKQKKSILTALFISLDLFSLKPILKEPFHKDRLSI